MADTNTDGGRTEPLPWDDVQYFLELARRGTLARASRGLGVSHTTVLRRVASLERRLDRKLFDRSHAGFDLTIAGEELVAHAEEMEAIADGIFSAPGKAGPLAGTVRVAIVEGLACKVVTPALARLRDTAPELQLDVTTVMQLANLTKREADISVSLSQPSGRKLVAQKVTTSSVHLYASKQYLARYGCPNSVGDLDQHSFVDYVEDMIEIQALRWLSEVVQARRVVFRSTSPLVQLAAVRTGLGIGMFPDYLALDEPDLVPILTDAVRAEREFWVATHQDLTRIPRIRKVHEFIIACLAGGLGSGPHHQRPGLTDGRTTQC